MITILDTVVCHVHKHRWVFKTAQRDIEFYVCMDDSCGSHKLRDINEREIIQEKIHTEVRADESE